MPPLKEPLLGGLARLLLCAMVQFFLFGELLPIKIVPPAVAIVACSVALLIVYATKIEPVQKVLAEPFLPFTFSPAPVYQLGPFGTAAKKLKECDLKR